MKFFIIFLAGLTTSTVRFSYTKDPCTRLAALLDSVEQVDMLADAWHFSTAERKHIAFVVQHR